MTEKICRRRFLKLSAAAMAAGPSLLRASLPMSETITPRKLNVLLIFIDDLNSWIEPLGGHPQAKTPHMNRLAQMGMVFEQAYCPAPGCNTSRTAIMTGLRPSSSGIYDAHVYFRDKPDLKDWKTLPQYLQGFGYRTFSGGKVFQFPTGRFCDPQSWDVLFQQRAGTSAPPNNKQYPHHLNGKFSSNSLNAEMDWVGLDIDDKDTEDWKTADLAGSILRESQEKPFFLACGFFRPHMPWYAPKHYFDLFPLESITLPPYQRDDVEDIPSTGRKLIAGADFRMVRDSAQWASAVQGYLASVAFADACVGHLLSTLETSRHKDNTIVILMGDHGFHLGQKDHWGKHALWEQSCRTPLIMAVPGMTSPGSRCRQPVSLLDIHATLAELCGGKTRNEIEGQSLIPLLENPGRTRQTRVLMTHLYNNHALRSDQYRYIRYADGQEELYDHIVDPNEWVNLAAKADYRDVKNTLAAWLPQKNAQPFTPPKG